MKIVFMGTPDFAVESLKAIHKSNHDILAVVTVPDKQQGRGRKQQASAVKTAAEEMSYKVIQPQTLKSDEFKKEIEALEPECIVVVAFKILPESIFSIPVFGTINIHASLLPEYRGAAPINHAIMDGKTKTGVTSFYINEEVDAGTILLQKETEISETDNFGDLYYKLSLIGADLIVETLDKLDTEGIPFKVQDLNSISFAPKISKETCLIDWNCEGAVIKNHIRGLSPKPGAFTYLNGQILKILKADFENTRNIETVENGTISYISKEEFKVKVKDGYILPQELQLQGKKAMKVKDFLNGNKINLNDKLEQINT